MARALGRIGILAAVLVVAACADDGVEPGDGGPIGDLRAELVRHGFTGRMEMQLASRLGRPVDTDLAELGRLLFFDRLLGLHSSDDGAHGNSCAGCHSPSVGFGDTQPIAIGVDNNGIVGPGRQGPRNQRRSPLLVNIAFAPRLMWDGRFSAPSGDPFDNSHGFRFPDPEGTSKFGPNDPDVRHLLVAQAHIPPTELPEMTGFTGTAGTSFPSFAERMRLPSPWRPKDAAFGVASSSAPPTDVFDDGHGRPVPAPDDDGYRNEQVRDAVLEGLNANASYRQLFGQIYPDVAAGAPIDFVMVAQAIAEFQISLTFMDAPIDRFARGDDAALTESEVRGGALFFGRAGCVECHAVSGESNEMFSDFNNYRIGVPPIAPQFGVGMGNVEFADGNEDLGAEHSTGDTADRYAFRATPLRNIAVQPNFFHNGAFDTLEGAIRHHLDVYDSARGYDPVANGVPADLRAIRPSVEPVLADIDTRLRTPIALTDQEFEDLVAFVRDALLDERALPSNLCSLIPASVPSGMTMMTFQGC